MMQYFCVFYVINHQTKMNLLPNVKNKVINIVTIEANTLTVDMNNATVNNVIIAKN